MTSVVLLDTPAQARRRFIGNATDAVGRANVRALWTPSPTEGLTVLDGGPVVRTWTHATSPNARLSRLGQGMALAFNGTSDFLSTPDAADLSFVEPATVSFFAVANVTDTAALRAIVAKETTAPDIEWVVRATTVDLLQLLLFDQSAAVSPSRSSDTAVNQGAWATFGISYDGGGGATAANGITQFQNGALKASTATNNASYVTMDAGAGNVLIGAEQSAVPTSFFSGSLALVMVLAANLTAAQQAQLTQLARSFFGVPL